MATSQREQLDIASAGQRHDPGIGPPALLLDPRRGGYLSAHVRFLEPVHLPRNQEPVVYRAFVEPTSGLEPLTPSLRE